MRARCFGLAGLVVLGVVASAPVANAATITVTTTADVIAQDGLCSLREAVFAARFDQPIDGNGGVTTGCAGGAGDDVIQLPAGEYRLAAGGANEDGNLTGDLDTGPSGSMRIAGAGENATVIGAAGDRLFDVFAGASLGLNDLTVRDGIAPEGQSGGAVRNKGTFTAVRVAFINSAAGAGHTPLDKDDSSSPGGGGGAIQSQGQLQVSDAVFIGDRAGVGADGREFPLVGAVAVFLARQGGAGGAILVDAGSATLTNITVTGSRAGDGGRIANFESAEQGFGGSGGAIAVAGGSASIVNATFQGNHAGNTNPNNNGDDGDGGAGGAVAATGSGAVTIAFSTFSGNAAGVDNRGRAGGGASLSGATVGASVLADAGGACATLAPASLPNVVLPGDITCPGARVPGDPRLGALGDNGGLVSTMSLGAGSPAIDAIVGVPCPATDARGLARPRFLGCDAGAFEVQPGTAAAAAIPSPPGGVVVAGLRSIGSLSLSKTAFKTRGPNRGTTVRFKLGLAGRVVLTVTKPASGRRSNGRCVAPTRRLRSARRCIRQVTLLGSISRTGKAGTNSIRFTGLIGGRRLAPGSYRLVLTLPKTASSAKLSISKAFRIAH